MERIGTYLITANFCIQNSKRKYISYLTCGWSGEESGNRTLVSMRGDATTEDEKDAESGDNRGAEPGSRPDVEGGGSDPEIGVGAAHNLLALHQIQRS
jgi:hypothetical protein